ncbi:MAG TPA: prepilin-type N-terminal cleavage/methylation domain-containing protein [Candidatus Moranbacteria bacterium]|nr:prepilin-type N-terminal cleavage/methylation domain-containing protein [Candidatus Moranbacteria bacterium]
MKRTKLKKLNNKKHKGFSLLEMLISIFIFSLIIITSVSIFAASASARQKSRKIQKNMEDARTALDLMAKNMRMSTELNTSNGTDEDTTIYMNNSSQGCISYKFESNKLQIGYTGGSSDCSNALLYPSYNDIMESDVSGKFYVKTTLITEGSKRVGRATISLTVDGINLETSVSFRDYNEIIQ